jgi:hypothetical protein
VIVGLGWVLPAMPLIAWMVRPDKGPHPEERQPISDSSEIGNV